MGLAALVLFFIKKFKVINYIIFLSALLLGSSANYIIQSNPGADNIAQILPYEGIAEGKILFANRDLIVNIHKAGNSVIKGRVLLRGVKRRLNPGAFVIIRGKFYEPESIYNPGQFDWKGHLRKNKIFTICDVYSLKVIKQTFISSLIGRIRNYIFESIEKYLPERESGILKGIMLGNPGLVADNTIKIFRKTGVIHILAVSGLHVGLLLGIFYYFFLGLRFNRKYALLISLMLMYIYVAVAGGRPSAIRAAIMLSMVVVGDLLGGRGNAYNSLCFAAICILILNPGQLFTAGFLLSFLAVSGIIYLSPLFSTYLGKPFSVSLGAVLAISPVLIWNFNYVSLIAPVINLLIIPLTAVLVALGVIFLVFSLISSFLAEIYSVSITYIIKTIEFICSSVYNSGLTGIDVARPSIFYICIYYILLILIGIRSSKKRNILIAASLLVFGLGFINQHYGMRRFIAVLKSGDSSFAVIKLNKQDTILVSGKNDIDKNVLRSFINSRGIKQIKHLYMLYPVYESMTELAAAVNMLNIERVFYSGEYGNKNKWYDFLNHINKSDVSEVKKDYIIGYNKFRAMIVSPEKKYIDIRDNFVEIDFQGKNNVFIYAGGDIPENNYEAVIAFDPYKPDWELIRKRCQNLIIYIGNEEPPSWVYWINKKGKIFYL